MSTQITKFIGGAISILITVFFFLTKLGSPLKKRRTIKLVRIHLEKMGETTDTIKSITPNFDSKRGQFNILVEFNDEQNVIYDYRVSIVDNSVFLNDILIGKRSLEKGKHDSCYKY